MFATTLATQPSIDDTRIYAGQRVLAPYCNGDHLLLGTVQAVYGTTCLVHFDDGIKIDNSVDITRIEPTILPYLDPFND